MSAASLLPSRCGTRNRASDSGSATVADSPIARISRRQPPQPRQAERQQIAALGGHQRMQFVEHDALERGKQKRRVVGRQQQRQLFRRGEQNIRRIAPLPLPPRHRRIAGAGLDLDRQPHLGDRRLQIARDVDRERLQRRDVEGVAGRRCASRPAAGGDRGFLLAAPPFARRAGRRASSTSVGRNPASVLPAPVGAISSAERSSRAFASSAS